MSWLTDKFPQLKEEVRIDYEYPRSSLDKLLASRGIKCPRPRKSRQKSNGKSKRPKSGLQLKQRPRKKKKPKWLKKLARSHPGAREDLVSGICRRYRLTEKQTHFVRLFTDPAGPHYLNRTGAYKVAYNGDPSRAHSRATTLVQRPNIMKTLKDLFEEQGDLREKILRGMAERLADPMSRHFQPSAEFVAKVLGDFAPDKHLNVNVNKEDRDAFYERVMAGVAGQVSTGPETPAVEAPKKPEEDSLQAPVIQAEVLGGGD